jgi:hypothetical protein
VSFLFAKEKKMAVIYGVKQIRVTPLLDTGAPDASATAITSTKIQKINITDIYIDGNQADLRGGDAVVASIQEDDIYKGENLSMSLATAEADLKAAMAGGTATDDKWEAPKDATEMPYPYKLEVWATNFTESDSESVADGYIYHIFAFCKRGRLGGKDMDQQAFSVENYTCEARRNDSDPSDIKAAWEHDIVESIT